MNFRLFFLILFCLYFLPLLAFAGTAHYVNCSAGSNGNGSYTNPWNDIASANRHSFSTGDDVYFKVNTTCTLTANSDRLQVDWSGASGDRIIIGAYYGNGQFGLNGNPRPVIDGDNNTYPAQYQALVEVWNDSVNYVTVKDLKLQYSNSYGFLAMESDNVNVKNCHIYRTAGMGIVYAAYGGDGVDTGTISDNIVENTGHPDYSGSGAAIEITAMDSKGATTNITVTRNIVHNGKYEGIGFYKGVTYSTAEYNVVRDMRSFHLYFGQAKYCKFRYNLVYESTDKAYGNFTESEYAIASNIERWQNYAYNGDNEIYGNLVAGMNVGIAFECRIAECTGIGVPYAECKGDFSSTICHGQTKVYNNNFVDNNINFKFENYDSDDSIEIKNNISWTITPGTIHADNYSPAGVTWSHNLFDNAVTGNASTNAVISYPALKKSSGWRSLTSGSLDGAEFSLLSSSKARNAGRSIASYNNRIVFSDYTADPITITVSNDSTPDIGAWMYNEGNANYLDPPTDLTITVE